MMAICLPWVLLATDIAVATIFRDEAVYLKEFVEYHRMIGVTHFYLYNNESQDSYLEVLTPYIDEGLVEVIDVPVSSDFIGLQCKVYSDAVSRALGKSDWVAFIDTDEFLLPMQDGSLTECLERHFSDCSAIYACWRMFGTSSKTIPNIAPIVCELTMASKRSHVQNYVGKSLIRPEVADTEKWWHPHFCPLKGDLNYVTGDKTSMRFNGIDLVSDFKTHDKYLRINHYIFRDEGFFYTHKMERIRRWQRSLKRVMKHYYSFNLVKETTIIDFIKKNYRREYETIWNH